MNIEYCEANASDAQAVVDYLNIVTGQTDNLNYGNNEFNLNAIQEMEFIKEMHENSNSVMILAKDKDKIVGIATLKGHSQSRLKHRADLGVSVLKEYWNQKIGTNLVAAIIGYGVEAGIEIIDLEVVTDNEFAIALYHKFGFEIIGTYENYMKLNDRYLDVYLMNLYL